MSIKVTTEKIPDLEVSWQEPPEIVWTAEKASSATKKPATNVKHTTTRPTKITETATKPTESTTKKATTNMELQSEFTKSNEDGMELIAVSDKTKPSTPSFGVRPITNRPIQSILNLRPAAASNLGLEATTVMLDEDIRRFIDLNNDIAIRLYKHTTSELDTKRSIAISPFGATSLIGMVFIGSRGQTSAQINDFLPFDDMITFNPHLVMRNITDSVIMSPELRSAAIVRQLYSQKV
jgi:Serpin (serine protease inhibitor)